MENIQIYVHAENAREPKLVEIAENATVAEIIEKYQLEFPVKGEPQEIILFLEDEDGQKMNDYSGFKKRAHIHCHRCDKISVSVIYNGDDKKFDFKPSKTIRHILKKAVEAFGIQPSDAGDYLLKLDDKTILQPGDHIGSFASWPACHVKLYLTPTKPIQG